MNGKMLIWSIEHNAWWRAGSNGYTGQLKDAGRYELQEALDIIKHANYGLTRYTQTPNEAIIPEDSLWKS